MRNPGGAHDRHTTLGSTSEAGPGPDENARRASGAGRAQDRGTDGGSGGQRGLGLRGDGVERRLGGAVVAQQPEAGLELVVGVLVDELVGEGAGEAAPEVLEQVRRERFGLLLGTKWPESAMTTPRTSSAITRSDCSGSLPRPRASARAPPTASTGIGRRKPLSTRRRLSSVSRGMLR